MAGLESIALALDFLEQRDSKKEAAADSQPTLIPQTTSPPAETPMPQRTGFLNAPRRVSSDSINEEEGSAPAKPTTSPETTPPIASSPPPGEIVVSSDMPPEVISRMVEDLSNDAEFPGPPPPPPPPTEIISQVMDCDVLCGRGGETNHHSGNVKYRTLVKKYQPLYILSKRRDKPLIASKIVRLVRHAGGRFLRKDKSNNWRDVGNTKAREKTSQALREGAPDLRSPQKNKEEQASKPNQTLATTAEASSLGVRKQPDFPGYGAAIGGLFAMAAVVETRPGEVDRSAFNAAKKMRLTDPAGPPMVSPGASFQGLPPQFWGGPQHAFLHAAPQPSQFFGVPPPAMTMAPKQQAAAAVPSSPTFVAAVSADDDESNKSEGDRNSPSPKPRGPRLKLLKRRLQEEKEDTGN